MEAYIISGVRTPIGSFTGSLSSMRADDMAAFVLRELLCRNPAVDPSSIDDVILGCANQAGEDNRNVARMALLLAGYPVTVPGETVNRLCASGLSAAALAARTIRSGEADLVVAGGVEQMTRGPWVMSKTSTAFGRDMQLFDSSFGWRFINPLMKELYGVDAMGETAENLAEMYSISRVDQDKFAFSSQQKAVAAQAAGRLAEEIVPVTLPVRKGTPLVFEKDEFIKPGTTPEILAGLKPAFRKDGTVTAGNSSGLNDGAAALLIASGEAVRKFGLKPLARIVGSAVAGVEPRIMGIGPVEAVNKLLKKAALNWDKVGILELNEAFAAQSLACIRQWGLSEDDPRINPNGGAIALGHPLGCTGARQVASVLQQLKRTGGKYACTSMCIGTGMGAAAVFEREN